MYKNILIILIMLFSTFLGQTVFAQEINSYDECVKAGNPVLQSAPARCMANGKTFIESNTKFSESAAPKPLASMPMPDGNYQSSCFNCSLNEKNNTLSCACFDKNQMRKATSLIVSKDCNYIENINGDLKCTRWNPQSSNYNPNLPYLADIYAGWVIWNQSDAEIKCPRICGNNGGKWNGQWHGTVCQCGFNHPVSDSIKNSGSPASEIQGL